MISINIHSVHFDADKKLQIFIEDKVKRLVHLYDKIIEAEVFLRAVKTQKPENKIVEIKLAIPGNDLFAKKQCKTFEEATDEATEALRNQIAKIKGKQRK